MENTIYYTFSTISQTLAGALGLLAAFMIIRINAFNQLIYERMAELHAELGWADEEFNGRRWRGDAVAFFAYVCSKQEDTRAVGGQGNPPPLNRSQEGKLAEGESMTSRKTHLLAQVARVLAATSACIVFCFVILGLTTTVSARGSLACAVLAAGIILASACVVFQVRLVLHALTEA
jgi:hypothetical protein